MNNLRVQPPGLKQATSGFNLRFLQVTPGFDNSSLKVQEANIRVLSDNLRVPYSNPPGFK
ncbi:hypothetical protein DY000_02007043 [Brassica cretica]|uniref:Uncharacterized protein n=1 Tax=Brassica cretica TaxID=69181 RepID=A0ABQ7CFU2_BRACR|nr:hypothetical protein DY000_02007043 [Brassica cretica]